LEIEPHIELVKKEVKAVKLEVGIKPLVEKVKTIEIVVEEKNV